MEHIFRLLHPCIRAVVRQPIWVLGLALLATIASVHVTRNLVIDPDFASLIPEQYPSVRALEQMRATIGGGDVSVDLAVESPSFEASLAFAEEIVPLALALRDERSEDGELFFVRAELRRETDFLRDNALYIATDAELDQVVAELDDAIYEAKLEANPFFFDLNDEEEEENDAADELQATFDRIIGKEYYVSEDSITLVVRFFTGGSVTDVGYIEHLYGAMERTIASLEPSSFHPELTTALAGRLWRHRIEVRTVTNDVMGSFGTGLLCVLLVIMVYFLYKAGQARGFRRLNRRAVLLELLLAPTTALIIGVPLLASLCWTAAVACLTFGTLNLLSSTLGLVLFGLGVDYGIHFYARYVEERTVYSPQEAAVRTFMSTGQAIAVGALTTASALYVLVIADFQGFSQFGFIAGSGVLLALVAMLFVLPSMLVAFEWVLGRTGFRRDGGAIRPGKGRLPGARGLLLGSIAAVMLAMIVAPSVRFEYRFGELEPVYEEWVDVATRVGRGFYEAGRRNPAYIVLDDPAKTPVVAAVLRDKMNRDTTTHVVDTDTFTTTILSVETLQERFPMTAQQQQDKLAQIAYIRDTLLADPILPDNSDMATLRRAAQTRAPIALEEFPGELRKRFTSKTGELGTFVTIYPAVGLSDGRKSMAFADDVGEVVLPDGETYYAGSSSIVAADMLRLMRQEAPYMVIASLIIVMLLMWANFLRFRLAFLAFLPMVVGVLWMLLVMKGIGLRMNFYNMVVLPAVIGIGNDAGAHIVHRYREEGRGSLRRVLRSTGEHVAISAVTTMVGFSGLLLSFHPGLNSIGALALIGIGTTLLAALLFLPALIQVLESRADRQSVSSNP